MTYDEMFERATGRTPFPYQRRLALTEGSPVALSAPTGAGKTAAAALAWLYKRRFAGEPIRRATPRRLVFCLPMRTLVSQTAEVVEGWLEKLGQVDRGRGLDRDDGVGVHVIMGGDVKEPAQVLRRRDAVDLFDTTADLGGADLDVSRFIREGDERDVPGRGRQGGTPPGSKVANRMEVCGIIGREC